MYQMLLTDGIDRVNQDSVPVRSRWASLRVLLDALVAVACSVPRPLSPLDVAVAARVEQENADEIHIGDDQDVAFAKTKTVRGPSGVLIVTGFSLNKPPPA